ncbi:SDR family NAD(P)-dependent oxidoreductase [Thermococcus sp.]
MELTGKVAIITGGGRGIGWAIAVALAAKGANVAINYAHSREKAEETAELCRSHGVDAITVKAEVSNREEVRKMVEEVVNHFGRIDILVNNAGILGKAIKPMEVTDDDWDAVLGVNLKGAFIVTQEVLKYMKGGKIVNIASIAGKDGGTVGPHYAASKGGLIALTFNLARHLAPNILVNAIAPGPVDTELIGPEIKERLRSLSLTEEIAHAVIFLLENDHITGELIDVNGGRLMD